VWLRLGCSQIPEARRAEAIAAVNAAPLGYKESVAVAWVNAWVLLAQIPEARRAAAIAAVDAATP
jgi:hypothetical protein